MDNEEHREARHRQSSRALWELATIANPDNAAIVYVKNVAGNWRLRDK